MKIETVNLPSDKITEFHSPQQALSWVENYIKSNGFPHPTPFEFIQNHREATASSFISRGRRLTVKDLLPGNKLRSGSSMIEITKLLPTDKEVVYRTSKNQYKRVGMDKFIQLANQQGYRKVWEMGPFLSSLKNLLKPVLTAVPLMFVMKVIIDAIRKKPLKFDATLTPLK